GTMSGEVGHPSYQHPQRLREGTYSLEVDRFALLLIATALRALTVFGRPVWEKYDNSDNLLFKEADLLAPTRSFLFVDVISSADPMTALMAKYLVKALRGTLETVPILEEVMQEAQPVQRLPRAAPVPLTRLPPFPPSRSSSSGIPEER